MGNISDQDRIVQLEQQVRRLALAVHDLAVQVGAGADVRIPKLIRGNNPYGDKRLLQKRLLECGINGERAENSRGASI